MAADHCLNDEYKPLEAIGAGMFGEVIRVCAIKPDGGCDWVVKIIKPVRTPDQKAAFDREVKLCQIASEKGFGPKFRKGWICDDAGYIVMQKLDITLQQYLNRTDKGYVSAAIQQMLVDTISKMCRAGVIHDDLHASNIMLKLGANGEPLGAYVIDYGLATIPEWEIGNTLSSLMGFTLMGAFARDPDLALQDSDDFRDAVTTIFPGGVIEDQMTKQQFLDMEGTVCRRVYDFRRGREAIPRSIDMNLS